MKAKDLAAAIEDVLKPEYCKEGEVNGLKIGDPERDVTKMGFCWSPTADVLEEAALLGCQAVFSHEIPYIPGPSQALGFPKDHPEIPANRTRRLLYEEHGFVLIQHHSTLDNWPIWGMPRALADAIGLDPSTAEWPRHDVPVLPIEPQPVRKFAAHVRDCLDMTGIGVSGDLNRTVTRVGLVIGGFGKQWRVSELPRVGGADCMITGELLDYAARAAIEADMAVIQASHYTTESPGVKKLMEYMTPRLEGKVETVYLDCGESVHYRGADL
jgi:putative NIF3 family GTP cyclohydrolase 1 type 2